MIIENTDLDIENCGLDYVYELKRIIIALAKLTDRDDEKSKIERRKLVYLHSIFSLRNNVKYFDQSDKNYYYAIASKNNANHAYEDAKYEIYADEMILLEKYIKENEKSLNCPKK